MECLRDLLEEGFLRDGRAKRKQAHNLELVCNNIQRQTNLTWSQETRTIDVLFVGGYSRHHSARAKILEQVASLAGTSQVVYCLDASRLQSHP